MIDGYAHYPACCDIGSTAKFGSRNQILGANAEFLKDRRFAINFLKALVEAQDFFTRNPDRTVDVIRRHATLDIRADIRLPLMPKFGFTKAGMNAAVAAYFDLSYLSKTTAGPVVELSQF